MFTVNDLWAGVARPLVLTAATVVIAAHITRRRFTARDSRSWAGPLAVGIGFAGGYWSLFGWGGFPPLDASEWLLFLTLPLVILGTLDSLLHVGLPGTLLTTVVAAPSAMLLLSWPLVKSHDTFQPDALLLTVVASALTVGWIVAMDALAARVSAARLSAILLVAAAPASVALGLSGSQRLAQIGGALAATQAGAMVAHLGLGHAGVGRGSMLVSGVLYAGLLLCGHVYAQLTLVNAVLLFAAPAVAWAAQIPGHRFDGRKRWVTQLAAVAAVAGWAMLRAILEFNVEATNY
jgi:hypothetical protein